MARFRMARRSSRREQAQRREARWRKVVGRWPKSGLTQSAFCEREGVSLWAFRWWKRELARRDEVGRDSCRGRESRCSGGGQGPGFAPVRVVESRSIKDAAREGDVEVGGAGVEVVLANGRRVRVGPGVDGELLAKVVCVLEGLGSW